MTISEYNKKNIKKIYLIAIVIIVIVMGLTYREFLNLRIKNTIKNNQAKLEKIIQDKKILVEYIKNNKSKTIKIKKYLLSKNDFNKIRNKYQEKLTNDLVLLTKTKFGYTHYIPTIISIDRNKKCLDSFDLTIQLEKTKDVLSDKIINEMFNDYLDNFYFNYINKKNINSRKIKLEYKYF